MDFNIHGSLAEHGSLSQPISRKVVRVVCIHSSKKDLVIKVIILNSFQPSSILEGGLYVISPPHFIIFLFFYVLRNAIIYRTRIRLLISSLFTLTTKAVNTDVSREAAYGSATLQRKSSAIFVCCSSHKEKNVPFVATITLNIHATPT